MGKDIKNKSEQKKVVVTPKIVVKKVAPKKVISKLPTEIGASGFDLRNAVNNIILKLNELIDHGNASK